MINVSHLDSNKITKEPVSFSRLCFLWTCMFASCGHMITFHSLRGVQAVKGTGEAKTDTGFYFSLGRTKVPATIWKKKKKNRTIITKYTRSILFRFTTREVFNICGRHSDTHAMRPNKASSSKHLFFVSNTRWQLHRKSCTCIQTGLKLLDKCWVWHNIEQ